MEVEANGQSSINLLETWRHHPNGGCHDDLAISPLELASNDLAQVPRCPDPDPLFEVLMGDGSYTTSRHGASLRGSPTKSTVSQAWTPRTRLNVPSTFSFTVLDARMRSKPLDIRLQPTPTAQHGVKRRRYVSDVDGFNTAGLSVKKRRLRIELVTSRLSQPYSQPATHILNREGQESGDKRFLKMATSVDMARRVAHLHATSFLRFSTMNRLRRRLSLGPAFSAKRYEQEIAAIAAKATGKATWRPQSLLDTSAGKSLRINPGGTGIVGPPGAISPTRPQGFFPIPMPNIQHGKPTACRLSKPAALPLPIADAAATKNRTSPRIHPIRSPELRPSSPLPPLDDVEEDSFAFMHPADDDWDDTGDDQESVYSDFNVLFGQGSEGTGGEDERSYEEYLDELDGICWMSR
ncbi:hypothetical protein FALBO_9257 [Fusarium albosuccineum]|uniref:Uncharacterized protein n=1 Tax=Fusarium albosuccineum TaxID=1237068 RepID=A0A8H4L965_9HYPO|nr:hypothetical protein FALBO_9257 [Fusarium albosuccineum]